jgi:hypothetical protein
MKRRIWITTVVSYFLLIPFVGIADDNTGEKPLYLVKGAEVVDLVTLSARFSVYWMGEDFFIGTPHDDFPGGVSSDPLSFVLLEQYPSELPLYIVHPAPDKRDDLITAPDFRKVSTLLYLDDEMGIIRSSEDGIESLLLSGYRVIRVFDTPLPGITDRRKWYPDESGHDSRHDPIRVLVGQVSEVNLESNVQRLQDFATRYVQSDSIWAAGQWIYDQFVAYGYSDVVFDTLSVLVFGERHRNILATKPGVGDPERVVIIGAHYDSYAYGNPWDVAPGADDDGSGVSAVLEVARVLVDEPLDATVMFAAWTAEEVGLVGSGDFVERAYHSGLGIELYMNLDACGYLGDSFKDVDLLSDDPSRPFSELMVSMAERYTTLVPFIVPNIDFSDHASFRQYGYPFTYSLEGEITPYIHTPSDLVETLDLPYMREIVQMNLATLVEVTGLAEHRLFISLDPQQQGVQPGDTLRFDTRLVNNTGASQNGDLWFDVVTADSVELLIPDLFLNISTNPLAGTLVDGQDVTLGLELYIPKALQPGTFLLFGRVGSYGGSVVDEDWFDVTVR